MRSGNPGEEWHPHADYPFEPDKKVGIVPISIIFN
jgi:hypothetical protein